MSEVSGTYVSYYHFCKRRMWLFAHSIRMEHTSEIVADGRFIDENSYPQRAEQYTEISIGSCKIDFFDKKNKIIHETKRSTSFSVADEWQLKYYIYVMEQAGIEGVMGVLEYPRLRTRREVYLTDPDRAYLAETVVKIQEIIAQERCPPRIDQKICKSCSYYDFCWVSDD